MLAHERLEGATDDADGNVRGVVAGAAFIVGKGENEIEQLLRQSQERGTAFGGRGRGLR
jgi:hypothetical protein